MEKVKYRQLFTQKKFIRLLFADIVSRFGDSLDAVVYSWIMFEITGSESLMALILGLNYLPTVLLQPILGSLVDILPKKTVMIITDVLRFCIVASIVMMYSSNILTPAILAVLTICTSTVEAFRIPAGSSFVVLTLDSEYYTLGKAASYSASRAAEMIGLLIAGGLVAFIGSIGVLWIDAVTFLISAIIIFTIFVQEQTKKTKVSIKVVMNDFREGLVFLKKNKSIQMVGLIGVLINFGLMPLSVFQTPYVSEYLNRGPETLSLIKILMITGMMIGASIAPKLSKMSISLRASCAGVLMGIAISLMYIAVVVNTTLFQTVIIVFSMLSVGFGGGMLNVIIGSSMMHSVPKDMMGRISGLNAAFMQSSMPIGAFICSALAVGLDITYIFLMFGCLTIITYIVLGIAGRFKSL